MKKSRTALLLLSLTCLSLHGSLDVLLEPVSRASFQPKAIPETDTVEPLPAEETPAAMEPEEIVPEFTLSRSLLTTLLREELMQKFSPRGTLTIELTRPWEELAVNPSNWTIKVTEFPAEGLQKKINLRFRVYSDSTILGEWFVPLKCALWQEGLLLKTKLDRGQSLEEDFFRKTPVNVLESNSLYVPTYIELADYEVTRSITHSSLLEWSDIREKPAVRKGQMIEILAEDGLMSIRTKGTAVESGAIGEIIAIRNLTSSKKLQGKIINDNTVQVYF